MNPSLPRLKREQHNRTKHDSHFSKWKVLIGCSDWEDYSLGKEGSERYRVRNLPGKESPGVYELGVGVFRSRVEADMIVVVYLGQADSVRARLQQYGRTGAHLGKCRLVGDSGEERKKGPGLFEEMMGRGHDIVYRWAPMETKSEALKTESQLLNTFDYAWNTSINGARRPDDVLQRLKKISSKHTQFANIIQKLLPFSQKQVGIRIKSSKLAPKEEKLSYHADSEDLNIIPLVFKYGRSQPRLVADRSEFTQENTILCGVAIGDGSICRHAPVQGRKRCAMHKGMSNVDSKCSVISNKEFVSDKSDATQEDTIICGVAFGDGAVCRTAPVQGRTRCAEHKGMRIKGSIMVK